MIERLGSPEDDETCAEGCAKQHGDPCKEREFRLFVRRTELHCCKTAAASHPDREKDGTRSGKQDEPAEMRNDETLDGTEGRPGSGGIDDGIGDNASVQDGHWPKNLVVVVAKNAELLWIVGAFHKNCSSIFGGMRGTSLNGVGWVMCGIA